MNPTDAVCSGIKDGKRCSKLISNDAVFCFDCGPGHNASLPVSTTSSLTNRCINCGQNIITNQLFCDKCGFKLGSVCVGEVNGHPCSKFISVETKFCANCGTANTGNSSVIKKAVLKKSCKSCGYDIESNQKFCNNCGYKIGAQCLGKIKGDPCTQFLSIETKCCSNCGTANPDCITAQCQSQRVVENKHESVMKLFAATCPREPASDASISTDGNEGELENSILSLTVDNNSMEENKALFIQVLEEMKESDEGKRILEDIKDSDEEKICEITATDLSSENSEEVFEELGSKGSIINYIQNLLKTKGVIATRTYLTEHVSKWKRAKVKIAVAGQSAAGKSAFINAIRGVVFSDEGYAKEGFGDTTLNIEEYLHPNNKQIIYCDLPGYGTTTITRDKFLEKVNISEYDMFLIFFTSVPTTDDEWLVIQLRESNIPFCFVRTKLDHDIENGKRMGKSKTAVLVDIKNAIARATGTMPVLKDAQMFVISNPKPYVGDMSKLVNFMQERVTKIKCEAILFSIPAFTEDIIESKYQDLLRRMPYITFLHALLADPFVVTNRTIMDEIRMYFRVFELDTDYATCVPGLKHHFDNTYVDKLTDDLTAKMPSADVQLIPIYSTIKTYKICKKYLTNLLDELKIDAHTMYVHMTTTV